MEFDNNIRTNGKPLLKGWIRALLIIIPFIIFSTVSHTIGYRLLGLDLNAKSITLIETTVIKAIVAAGSLLLVFIFVRYIDRTNLKCLGFRLEGFRKKMLSGIFVGMLIITVGYCILLLLGEIQVTGIDFDLCKLLTSVAFFLFVAFDEELIVRGYILMNLLQSMNRYVALVLSAAIFSTLHIFNPNFDLIGFVGITLAGLMLGISYIYTRNLWFPIALHFSWNFFQGTVFGFKVSGQEIYSVITQYPIENNLLNGGEFGFEGSIISQILIVIAIPVIWLLAKKRMI